MGSSGRTGDADLGTQWRRWRLWHRLAPFPHPQLLQPIGEQRDRHHHEDENQYPRQSEQEASAAQHQQVGHESQDASGHAHDEGNPTDKNEDRQQPRDSSPLCRSEGITALDLLSAVHVRDVVPHQVVMDENCGIPRASHNSC
jgi:hypothetical protein